jgi:hypothetical protein
MVGNFRANGLPVLIGSFPFGDHEEASNLIFEHTPQIPVWAQLPIYKEEGVMAQFAAGLPGVCTDNGHVFVNTCSGAFDENLLQFFEDYMAVLDGKLDLNESRFVLREDTARGFFVLLERLRKLPTTPIAVKGQVTGPVTFGTGVVDQNKMAIFYDMQIKDAALKLLAMKAKWQVRRLSQFCRQVMIFFDEPALAGVGSSEFTSISRDDVSQCFEEVFEAVHSEGGMAGVHVCANTDWSLVLESSVDIVSFDSYSYFDRFILYPDQIKAFIQSGRILAWGIVPTARIEDIERETAVSLLNQWKTHAKQIEALGIDPDQLVCQSLISPSCGMGFLSAAHTKKVLKLTSQVSAELTRLLSL